MNHPILNQNSHSSKLLMPVNDGFQHLDISYICPNLIAMSYPSNKAECEKRPGRNKIEQVKQSLRRTTKGTTICLEETQRSYSPEIFEDRVWFFGIKDQSPPPFELLFEICDKIKSWLGKSEKNVVVIHCKAGIGRTGTIACCFLLLQGIVSTAQKALKLFTSKRGIRMNMIIPSQKRWIGYFESYLRNDRHYHPAPILIHSFRLETTKIFKNHLQYFIGLGWMDGFSKKAVNVSIDQKKKGNQEIVLVLKHPQKASRDFELNFLGLNLTTQKKTSSLVHLFRCWINTAFLDDVNLVGEEQHFQFSLNREELEISPSGEDPSNLPSDLKVTMYYTRLSQEQEDDNQQEMFRSMQ